MSLFHLFFRVFLYFVSIGALLVLFGSVLTIIIWMVLKMRWLSACLVARLENEWSPWLFADVRKKKRLRFTARLNCCLCRVRDQRRTSLLRSRDARLTSDCVAKLFLRLK